jgi:cystathionine beta-synthase
LAALGSTIVRTPTEYMYDHVDSHIGIALQLREKLNNSHILDQYKNPYNPIVHYDETG